MDFATRLERLIGPIPGVKEARAISVLALIAGAISCALSIYYGVRGETFMGRPLGGDFVQFYSAGKILNDGPAADIYDIATIVRTEHESLPSMNQTQMLLFGNAPYVAALFRPFALLPYTWAYCAWLVVSLALYMAALRMLFRSSTPLLLALSSPMFLLETWIGGQVSVIGFLAVAMFVANFRRRRFFLAGLALALAAYKPSLIAVPAVMLAIGGCWRVIGGIGAGSIVAGTASLLTVSYDGCVRWIQTLRIFSLLATGADASIRRVKYVDLNSFFSILFGAGGLARACAIVSIVALLGWLARAWWIGRRGEKEMLLAATFAIMLAANFYVPVYDTIIVVAAAALAWPAFKGNKTFRLWIVLLYLVPSLTQSFAEFARMQVFTILLAAFGVWVLGSLRLPHRPLEADPGIRNASSRKATICLASPRD